MIEKKSIDIVFYNFENKNSQLLSELKTDDGILLWQIIKRPLFYKIVHQNNNLASIDKPKTEYEKLSLFSFFSSFLKLIKILFRQKEELFFTTDFRRRKVNNETIEPLIDSVIEERKPQKFLIGIQRRFLNKKDPESLRNKPDFDLNLLFYLKKAHHLFYKKTFSIHTKKLSNCLQEYLQSESVSLSIDLENSVLEILRNYESEKRVFSFFFRLVNPKKIYAVDCLATGIHHAAKKLDIPFFEIQHGFISDYKADYILHPKLKEYRDFLLIPTCILMFGDFYKNILLRRSIWEPSDIAIFHRIDSKKREEIIQNDVQIFFYPHQWVFYQETILIIKAFGKSNKELKIKFHPNEKRENLAHFEKLCANYNNIEIILPGVSISEACKNVDLVFGFFTTVLIETAAMEIPTFTLKTASEEKKTSIHQYVSDDLLNELIPEKNMDSFLGEAMANKKISIEKSKINSSYLQV